MTAHPQPPPEAALIQTRRDAPPKMSRRKAAGTAGLSESRWRQIEAGGTWYRGRWESQIAPAQTLALMAKAVGVTPAELTAAGRPDAAAELAAILPEATGHTLETALAEMRRLNARIRELEGEVPPNGKSQEGHSNDVRAAQG